MNKRTIGFRSADRTRTYAASLGCSLSDPVSKIDARRFVTTGVPMPLLNCRRCGQTNRFLGPPVAAFLLLVFLLASLRRKDEIPTAPQNGGSRLGEGPSIAGTDTFPPVKELTLGPGTRPFDNEGARRVGLPVRPVVTDQQNTSSSHSIKVLFLATRFFGEWNPRHFYFPHLGNATFLRYSCPVHYCHVTKDPSVLPNADAVLFHMRDLEVFSIPKYRTPNQLWILYSMEPPWLEIRDLRRFDGVFNWTMSYRSTSDLEIRYGFVGRRPAPPWDRAVTLPDLREKSNRAVWLVSNCQTDSNREGYVRRLKAVFPVDVMGGCGSEGCRPAESSRCYAEIARRYKFYLAFENAICRDYVTEKLFNAFEFSVLPVVLGGADYSRLTPNRSVIDAFSFPSPEALGRYLWQVSHDDTLYRSYFEWKVHFRSYLQPWMCDLCARLHRNAHAVPAKTGTQLEKWWRNGRCLRWTEDSFLEVRRHPFPKYRSVLFEDDPS